MKTVFAGEKGMPKDDRWDGSDCLLSQSDPVRPFDNINRILTIRIEFNYARIQEFVFAPEEVAENLAYIRNMSLASLRLTQLSCTEVRNGCVSSPVP